MTRVELDCRGVSCPRPIIELAKAVADVEVGDTVALVAPTTRQPGWTSQAWCRMRGQEYVGEEAAPDGVPTYVVRRVTS